MPHLVFTPIYTALLALLAEGLVISVIRNRRSAKVSLGTGGDALLERKVRAHGNCVEQSGFALLLLLAFELNGGSVYVLHAAALCLLVGRVVHARSLITGHGKGRVAGMALTFTSYAILIPANLVAALAGG